MDAVGAGRASGIRDVATSAQALTIRRAIGASRGQRWIDRVVYMVVAGTKWGQE